MTKTRKVFLPLLMLALVFILAVTMTAQIDAATTVASGSCGTNLTYTLDSNGVLTISGTGDMTDWNISSKAPWDLNRSSIKTVKINSGVTSIGRFAFRYCTDLSSITIPDSVMSIGSNAFYKCTSLSNITIPDSVTCIDSYAFNNSAYYNKSSNWENEVLYIGNHLIEAKDSISGSYVIKEGTKTIAGSAFWYNDSLSSIIIPDSVISIGNSAFSRCTGLSSITIPDSVTSIGDSAFYECIGLSSITIPDGVTGIGYHAFKNTAYYNESSNWENEVLYIGNHLIEAKTSISGSYVIKEGTKTIADWAFVNCNGLSSITIPDSVTTIGDSAFANCNGLSSITIPDSVTTIGDSAFSGCTGLSSITIPDSVTCIGDSAFADCTGLSSITIPDSVTCIGNYAFRTCISLNSITIPDSVTCIGDSVFSNCIGLSSITVDKNNTKYSNDESGVLYNKDKTYLICCPADTTMKSYVIPDSVTVIGNYAFADCNSLISITIPDGVTSIGVSAFSDCDSLISITIPDGVTCIGYSAFYSCTDLSSITIPDSVTCIDGYAFWYCRSLRSIAIPDSVTYIGNSAFYSTAYYNDSSNWENEVLYIGNHLIKALESISGSYVVKEGTKTIADQAFYNCTGLSSITIPDSVTSIGSYAFYNCTGLSSITIPDSVISIGSYAFFNCTGLSSVTIPDSVTCIGDDAFFNCPSLSSITIPDSVTYIGDDALGYSDSEYGWIENFTIKGYVDSAAEEYANDNYFTFVALADTRFTITYDLNGGKGDIPVGKKKPDSDYTLTSAEPEKENARFVGWSTAKNGRLQYLPGDIYTGNGDVTLFAVWYPVITATNKSVSLDSTFELPIMIYSNCGLTGLGLKISYPDSLELESVTKGTALKGLDMTVSENLGEKPVTVNFSGGTAAVADGVVVTLTFKVKENATEGDYSIGVNVINAQDSDRAYIQIDNFTTKIALRSFVAGDINGDIIVDLKDVTTIRRYLAGGYGVTVQDAALDINGDGAVDLKDVTYLRRALAGGYGVELE